MSTFSTAFMPLLIFDLAAGIQALAGKPRRFEPDVLRHASPGTHFRPRWQTMFDDYRVAPWCDPTNPNYIRHGLRRPPFRPRDGYH